MISRIAQCVWFLTKAFYCVFLPQPISNGCFCGAVGMEDLKAYLLFHILLSQRPDPKEKQVINLDQDVRVCGYIFLVDGGWTLLYESSLSCFFFFGLGLSFFLSSFFLFLWTCLVGMWHTFFGYAFFYFFLHNLYERDVIRWHGVFYLVDEWVDILLTSYVEV